MSNNVLKGSATAEGAVALSGKNSQFIKEDSVQMSNDAKIVGGDNNELAIGASLTRTEGNAQVGGYRVGDNSSLLLQSMDPNTKELLLSAINTMGQNADNVISLASGRDANLPLPNKTEQITAAAAANPISEFIKNNGKKLAIGGVLIVGAWLLWKKKK